MFKRQWKFPLSGSLLSMLLAMLLVTVQFITIQLLTAQKALALTDPTQPSSYQAATKKQSLRLESILFSVARKVAVINGSVVAEGDSIANAKIIQINKDSVKISNNGKVVELVLHRAAIRQEK